MVSPVITPSYIIPAAKDSSMTTACRAETNLWRRTLADDLDDRGVVKPDKFCSDCIAFCRQSKLLRALPSLCANNPSDEELGQCGSEYARHSTLGGLRSSYLQGCHLCSKIWEITNQEECQRVGEILLEQDGRGVSEDTIVFLKIEVEKLRRLCVIGVWIDNVVDGIGFPLQGLVPVLLSSGKMSDSPSPRKSISQSDSRCPPMLPTSTKGLTVSTASETSLLLAKSWLEACKKSHVTCERSRSVSTPSQPEPLPTRLIDVGEPDKPLSPRIYIPDPAGPNLTYLTLSHCWGTGQFLKLTLANMEDLKRGIPHDRLPGTFRDALVVTRALGHRFLWIDSLCICQDSNEDWKREAARMKSVYANSTCNLSALDGYDPRGFLSHRNPLIRHPTRLPVPGGVSIVAEQPHLEAHFRLAHFDFEDSKLLTRAWVFQERLLSPRNIFFSKSGLSWECHEYVASEPWSTGMPRSMSDRVKEKFAAVLQPGGQCDDETRRPFLHAWHLLVESYTGMQLTYSSDRIVAFSGVAGFVQQMSGLTYMAGLWREHLFYDLMWFTDPSDMNIRGEVIPKPPSWSWMSVEGPVIFAGGGHIEVDLGTTSLPILYQAEILDCRIKEISGGSVALGEVMEGLLVLRGLIKEVAHWRPQRGCPSAPYVAEFKDDRICTFVPDVESEVEKCNHLFFFLVACLDNDTEPAGEKTRTRAWALL
ncbi:heterokaryon incompatibility protein-domain-containing protein [Thelonectria olida]|uniref:Heterokaryon incompatibility protein-domain-containing protein n=1 Tax=Thelonectria olida TaxID=1576542 RepID=A0A9P8VPX7_9HYPO|nr:heterokaryon incompatibility protein-domain-containing protein [Thelonectria olida]